MTEQSGRVAEGQCVDLSENLVVSTEHSLTVDIINIYVPLSVSVCATVSNLVNIIIFWKLGLKDSMSVGLFSLSVSDFLTTLLFILVSVCYLTNNVFPCSPIDAWELGFFAFGWMMDAMYLTSCWIIAVITIERCFCVVFPFKVKQMFTRFRSFIVIYLIYMTNIGFHIPVYLARKMAWIEKPVKPRDVNLTIALVRVFTTLSVNKTGKLEKMFDITINLVLGDLSFVIVMVGTGWMIYALKETSKVRQPKFLKSTETDPQKSNLSTRERKLVKVALALAVTLSACSLPRITAIIVQNVIPNTTVRPLNHYIIILWALAYICTTCGCIFKTVAYLVLNTRFRLMFKQCFKCYHPTRMGWSLELAKTN